MLEDTERVFGFQHVALVIDEDKLKTLGGSEFMRIIDAVNEQLTTSAMIQMNRDVDARWPGPGDRRRAISQNRRSAGAPIGM